MMTEQSVKADAQNRKKRMPAQKLTASRLPDGKGQVEHYDKDRVISEFDDPAMNKIESPIRVEPRRAFRQL